MKEVFYRNPEVTALKTTTNETLEYGETAITVADSSIFSANDFVLFEDQGNEYNEILKISTVDSPTQITLSGEIQYPHVSGISITKLDYDKFMIEKSIDGASYTELVRESLDYSNKHNRIEYYDDLGLDSYYYKVYYRNSHTDTNVQQTILNNEDNFSWITLAKFQSQSGLDSQYSDFAIEALRFGVESIRDDLFFQKVLSTTDRDVQFDLNLEGFKLADNDGNREIDKDDMIIYEYDIENNIKTFLNHKIVRVFVDNPKIVFKERVPTPGRILYIEVPVAQVKYSDYKRSYEAINKLYAINYLLGDKTPDVVKNAILDWTAGGTSVTRNPSITEEIITKNEEKIKTLMKDLMLKTYLKRTKLRTRRSSVSAKGVQGSFGNNSISTPGGNTYRY